MIRESSNVLDSFDGLTGNDLVLRFALDSDFSFMASIVCHPSTVIALHETVESAQSTIRKIWSEGLKPPDLRHILAFSQTKGNHIGYLRLLYPFEFDQCLWLSFFAIVPELRGQGFGRKILELLLTEARKCQLIQKFGIHTGSTNVHARRLYESLGFECIKREPWENEYGTKEERLTFIQNLTEE